MWKAFASTLVCTSVITRQGIVQTSSIDSVTPLVFSTFQREYYELSVPLATHRIKKTN